MSPNFDVMLPGTFWDEWNIPLLAKMVLLIAGHRDRPVEDGFMTSGNMPLFRSRSKRLGAELGARFASEKGWFGAGSDIESAMCGFYTSISEPGGRRLM